MYRAVIVAAAAMAAGMSQAYAGAGYVPYLTTYADIAHAGYEDALIAARLLDDKVDALIAEPTAPNLEAARDAWLAARVPYQQTEVYRFGNAIVDDWEGRVNAWPLDEGLIDYVDPAYGVVSDENEFYAANLIANPVLKVAGREIDASTIDKALLADTLHELGDVEANVATGYHAIEFLLWGQDLNGTGPGAGNRPVTDFDPANCTGGNCDRRVAYLTAATDLLIDDLEEMVGNWAEGGAARDALMKGDAKAGLSAILTGLGSLSYGELAGERIRLGLMLHDPEEEHDCFSDNTHNSHFYNIVGMRNVYTGSYQRIDGSTVSGPSLADLVARQASEINAEMLAKLDASLDAAKAMVVRAETKEAYDQMIGDGNAEGNAVVQRVVDSLVDQTRSIERVVAALKLGAIEFEGSDSLDNPSAVFQ
ncbi:MAG: hypothetical protein MI806_04180 [Minwuiales bacterium]|nr:hypothetical protein [Minwuiales bacterium]